MEPLFRNSCPLHLPLHCYAESVVLSTQNLKSGIPKLGFQLDRTLISEKLSTAFYRSIALQDLWFFQRQSNFALVIQSTVSPVHCSALWVHCDTCRHQEENNSDNSPSKRTYKVRAHLNQIAFALSLNGGCVQTFIRIFLFQTGLADQ